MDKLITAQEAKALKLVSDTQIEEFMQSISQDIRAEASSGKGYLEVRYQGLTSYEAEMPVVTDKIVHKLTNLGFRVFWQETRVSTSGFGSYDTEDAEQQSLWILVVEW